MSRLFVHCVAAIFGFFLAFSSSGEFFFASKARGSWRVGEKVLPPVSVFGPFEELFLLQ